MLRYGENPHQQAALCTPCPPPPGRTWSLRGNCNGKELSYNNLLDLDGAGDGALVARAPAAVVIKHNNPCGAATGERFG